MGNALVRSAIAQPESVFLSGFRDAAAEAWSESVPANRAEVRLPALPTRSAAPGPHTTEAANMDEIRHRKKSRCRRYKTIFLMWAKSGLF